MTDQREALREAIERIVPPSSMRGERYRGWNEHKAAILAALPSTPQPEGLDAAAIVNDYIWRLTGPNGPMRTPMRGRPNVTTIDAIRVLQETLAARLAPPPPEPAGEAER